MKTFSLNGTWRMQGGGFDTTGEIPGSVYSFLKNNNLMIDPFYRLNETEVFNICNNDFTFERSFDFDGANCDRVILCFDGLDTVCEVYLNGEKILSSKNMHLSHEVDVTGRLKEKENHIKVVCYSPTKYVDDAFSKKYIFGSRHGVEGYGHLRKAHAMFGWDWGIRLPDMGIWRNVYLLYDVVDKITDYDIIQSHEKGEVFITPKVESERGSLVKITAISPDGEVLNFKNGEKTAVKNAKLWWPNGYGKQYLYDFEITVEDNGVILDKKNFRVGL